MAQTLYPDNVVHCKISRHWCVLRHRAVIKMRKITEQMANLRAKGEVVWNYNAQRAGEEFN